MSKDPILLLILYEIGEREGSRREGPLHVELGELKKMEKGKIVTTIWAREEVHSSLGHELSKV